MKYLITGDIHIDKYNRYNVTENSRFNQFRDLPDLYVNVAKKYGIKTIFLAGDILNKPINPPQVNLLVREFFDKLCDYFDRIYITIGNHDANSPVPTPDVTDLTLYFDYRGKVKYVHQGYVEDEGHVTYLQDYIRGEEIPTPEKKVDLMIGHVTLGNEQFKGQSLDITKFHIGIFGDIHKIVQVNNCHSIGPPVQVKVDEEDYGQVVVYDTETREFFREPLDPSGKILSKMVYTSDREKVGPDIETNTYYVYKPSGAKSHHHKVDTSDWNRIEELIDKVMESQNLKGLHDMLKEKVIYNPINFDFELKNISIRNYRSIKELDYEFSPKTLVLGENGSGKSSFLDALVIGLQGDRSLKDSVKIGEDECRIELNLNYEGINYKIVRNSHATDELHIDGVKQDYAKAIEVQPDIVNRLPFIEYLDSMVIDSKVVSLLGKMNSVRRVDLLSKHYKLDVLDKFKDACDVLKDSIHYTHKELEEEVAKIESNLEMRKRDLGEYGEVKLLTEEEIIELNNQITNLKNKISSYNAFLKFQSDKRVLESQIENDKSTLATLRSQIKEPSENNLEELKEKLRGFSGVESKVNEAKTLGMMKAKELEGVKSRRESLENQTIPKCSSCNQDIGRELHLRNIEELKNQEANLNEELTSLRGEYKLHNDRLKELGDKEAIQEEITKISTELSVYKSLKSQLESTEIRLKSNENKLTELLLSNTENVAEIDVNDATNQILTLQGKLKENDRLKSLRSEVIQLEESLVLKSDELAKLSKDLTVYEKYSKLMDKDGLIYTEILNRLTENFTNEMFEFKTTSTRKNGREFSDLSVKFNVNSHFIDYENLSSGQKTLCDIYFLYRSILGSGLLIFDEFLKYLDKDNLDVAVNMLTQMNVGVMLIATHTDNFTMDSGKILFELTSEGSRVRYLN